MAESLFDVMVNELDMDKSMIESVIEIRHICLEAKDWDAKKENIPVSKPRTQRNKPVETKPSEQAAAPVQQTQPEPAEQQPQQAQPATNEGNTTQEQQKQEQPKQEESAGQAEQQQTNKSAEPTQPEKKVQPKTNTINGSQINQDVLFKAYSDFVTNKQNELKAGWTKEYGDAIVNSALGKFEELQKSNSVNPTAIADMLKANKDKPIDEAASVNMANSIIQYWSALTPTEAPVEDGKSEKAPEEKPKVDYGEQPDEPEAEAPKQPEQPAQEEQPKQETVPAEQPQAK